MAQAQVDQVSGRAALPGGRESWMPAAVPSGGDGDLLASDLLATIAHELRTPLAAARVTIELLAAYPALGADEANQLVRRLQHSVGWLEGLVENLTIWAAVQGNRLSLRRVIVGILDPIERAQALVQPLLDGKHQRVRLDCPTPAPLVYGDPPRLTQVLVNLLTNASAYGPWGEPIEVAVSVTGGGVEVRVTDHGPGIPGPEQRRIFERYVRGSAAAPSSGGSGLGLDIVKALVEAHGGEVGLDSVPGHGASFWLRLPS